MLIFFLLLNNSLEILKVVLDFYLKLYYFIRSRIIIIIFSPMITESVVHKTIVILNSNSQIQYYYCYLMNTSHT
jgi:hypothetical protein